MARDEGILGRWSRRKLEARRREEREPETDAPDPSAREGKPVAAPHEASEPPSGAGSKDAAGQGDPPPDLPDIDSLDKDSDYTVFLREDVPQSLRNRALRKLWVSDPVFGRLDGLVEYGEDYTDAATVVEGMKTAYKVGRGYLSEEAEEAAPAQSSEETAEADEAAADGPGEASERAGVDSDGVSGEEDAPADDPEPGTDAEAPGSERRGRPS